MNLQELDSFNLADAVKFNSDLNPRIWQGQKMRPEVRKKLLEIAEDFREFLGVDNLDVKDITVSGSNASYHYTPYSDIDLHLVVDVPKLNDDAIFRELFDAKKYQYNDLHNIKIGGYDVELYVEDAGKPPVSQGIFSVLNNDWINIPRQRRATVDDTSVKSKYEDIKHRIESALKDRDFDRIDTLAKKIKAYRQAGLDAHGEFGPENIAFKMLRNQGYIGKLYDARNAARDAELSLNERKKKKRRVKYGFARTWGPVFDFGDSGEGGDGGMAEDATATPDGVNPTTQMFLNEKETPTHEEIIRDFLNFAVEKLNIDNVPRLRLKKDPEWSIRNKSFGRYDNATGELIVALGNRHIMDILRTLAHELTHRKQDERENMPSNAGETGSPYENEAHARAGVLMRDYAAMHPEYFEDVSIAESILHSTKTNQAEQFNWADWAKIDPATGVGLPMESIMDICETYFTKNKNLLESNNPESVSYFKDLFNLGQEPQVGKKYLMTLLLLVNDKILVQQSPVAVKVIKHKAPNEYIVEMPDGTTATFPYDIVRNKLVYHTFFFTSKSQYEKLKTAIKLKFNTDLNESASGYIPRNKKEAQDPRYAMALTVDIKPGQTGREANKMALKTDTQGKPELLIKSANLLKEFQEFKAGIVNEDEDLFEIKMTGKNLAKLASDIKGAKVGLEFEMIVPDASVEDNEDMEPDYDQDERVRDIDEAVEFFDDGDYNGRADLRRLRDAMQEAYWEWKSEKLDYDWYNGDGFDYFREWLENNDPFDDEEAEQEARNQLQSEYGNELDVEEFEKMLFALVDEKREAYVQEQWDDQSGNFDDARQEYDDEHRDDYSEEDWLDDQGIRYASDVENNFGFVNWPYYTSNSSEGEADIERIALEFMNDSGLPYDSVAVSSSYHGTYKKWVGNGWVSVGSNKPEDCFSIEPDGSLDGNDPGDAGLEFVSPPIPLEQVGDVMAKVQKWAAANGVYTGKNNKTSIHTNISIPGYSIENLDYLKAALLLGDEYVLRQFDRIGNSYAKPAIEKIKGIVNQKPEKAQELLDKMKSQLNAAASKLIHSGITDKFTSINTKNNRIEFRSPGGDYLSDIADDPRKMQDTINRMVVAMDAAMDPNKYKEEYQKKLYKVLTSQTFGREAKSGLKQEPKKDTNDLLSIFSRYAAGELPKAALKSFVRQAQTERKIAKGDTGGEKYWWNVKYNDQRMEVVAANKKEAKEVAAKEWGLTAAQADTITSGAITVLRPYTPPPAGSELERIERQAGVGQQGVPGSGTYRITTTSGGLIAGDEYGSDQAALERGRHWAQRRGVDVVVRNQLGQEIGRVSSSGEIRPTTQSEPTVNHNWAIRRSNDNEIVRTFQANDYMDAWRYLQQYKEQHSIRDDSLIIRPYDREDQQPGQQPQTPQYELYNHVTDQVIDTFPAQSDEQARTRLRDYINYGEGQSAPGDFAVRRAPMPGSTIDLQRQRAAQQSEQSEYAMYRISDGRDVLAPAGNPIVFRADSPEDAESKIARYAADFNLGAPELFAVRAVLNVPQTQQPAQPNQGNWGIWIDELGRFANQPGTYARGETPPLYRFPSREAAESWLEQQRAERAGLRRDIEVREIEPARTPVADIDLFPEIEPTPDQQQGGIVDVSGETPAQAPQTLTTPGQGQQVFTGEWKVVDPSGNEIYRFSGVGNSQSDANAVAIRWLQQNPRHLQGGVEVLPVMG